MKPFLTFIGVLVAIIATGFWFGIASAAGCNPFVVASGGTGVCAFSSGTVLYGNGTGKISTTTAGTPGYVLMFSNGVPIWAATSTSASGSVGNWFTPTTNFGALTNATGTPVWFQAGIQASSSAWLVNATTSTFAITGLLATNCNGTNALTTNSSGTVTCTAQPQGTVTAVSVATANGFAGSSGGGATPILTLTTTITGLLKGNGTAISAAAYTDFPTISANSVLANQTSSAAAPASLATSSLFTYGPGLTQLSGVQRQVENRGFTILATTTSIQGTTTIPLEIGYGETWNYVNCWTTPAGALMNIDFYFNVAGNATVHLAPLFVASSTPGKETFTSNNIITSGATTSVDVGTPVNSPTKISCTVNDTI